MSKYLAVEGCALITDNSSAQAQIMTPASTKVKAGTGCYRGVLQIQVTGASQGSFMQQAVAIGTLSGSAQKVTIENMAAVLEGDKTVPPVMCTLVDSSTGVTMQLPVTVTIQGAGQTKVKGN